MKSGYNDLWAPTTPRVLCVANVPEEMDGDVLSIGSVLIEARVNATTIFDLRDFGGMINGHDLRR